MDKKEINKLAKAIARGIMECGDEIDSPCQRLEFKGGHYPDEKNQGGLCENALVTLVETVLINEQ